jgi:SAM-dependent MidA family methyltransferase
MPSDRPDAAPGTLIERIRDAIRRNGPMPVDQYMQMCLGDPYEGYWQRDGTIGAAGDFITAPEISQVFGELVGLWATLAWQAMGRPEAVHLVELGPGRGTLMADALRAVRAVPGFLAAARVHLVEVSAPLRATQAATLSKSRVSPRWHGHVRDVPSGPAIVIANEFLDALPVRQLVLAAGGAWRERVVALADDGCGLAFGLGDVVPYAGGDVRAGVGEAVDGAVIELRAGEDELFATLVARAPAPVAALFIDYGPDGRASGDTLQAVRRHAFADPLAAPGAADLTAHVHFAPLADKARAAGFAADGPMPQAVFLGRLGAAERAARLMAANPARAGEIEAAVQRLVSPTGMGQLFKVLAVRSAELPPVPPFG